MTSLAHEICVQILKMEAVMDRVVDTQIGDSNRVIHVGYTV